MRQGADRAPLKDRGYDLYETPACATAALLSTGELIQYDSIWEPAAGRGAIARLLLKSGHDVWASDLVAHPKSDDGIKAPLDFLLETKPPPLVEAIVTNPPYMHADAFVRHGLALGLPTIVLLRLMALEGAKRSDLIDKHLVRVWAGIERLPKFQREGWDGPRQTTETAPFAWMVFSPEDRGSKPIELRRMSWRTP